LYKGSQFITEDDENILLFLEDDYAITAHNADGPPYKWEAVESEISNVNILLGSLGNQKTGPISMVTSGDLGFLGLPGAFK
jgi:hypothetical protein